MKQQKIINEKARTAKSVYCIWRGKWRRHNKYKPKSNKKMGNIETIKKMYELFAIKDYDAIRKIFDENIKWNQMKGFPDGGQYIGSEAIFEKVFGGFRQNWTNWKATITRYIDSGDGVFVVGFYEGTYNTTGRFMKSDFACEYKVKDGKITEFNQYTDTFLIGQAMGMTTTSQII